MKKLLLTMMLIFMVSITFLIAQAVSDYTFSTATDGSLEDMSTGTTNILGPGTYYDSGATPLTDIGFNFSFAGTIFTQFSANANGLMRLGSTVITTTATSPGSGITYLAPVSGDNAIAATGKIHYKVVGTSPDRRLIVEWNNLRIPYSTAAGTYSTTQAWLYETTNQIKFVYGTMYNNSTSAALRAVFISTSTVAGSIGCITTITTTPTWNTTATSLTNTSFPAASAMTNLDSSTDGSRRVFAFNPPVATAPPNPAVLVFPFNNGWTFTNGVLTWASGGGLPQGYDVYLDTVDGSTLVSDDQTGTTYTPTLTAGTTYYWKVVPYNVYGPATGCPVWSFRTAGIDQLAESFESTTFPPVGWSNPGAFTRSTTTPYHLTAGAYKSTAPAAMLYTPMLALTETSELNFMARSGATTGIGRIQIKHSTDGTTWSPIGAEIAIPTNSTWNNYVVDLSSLAGDNYMLGFEVYSSTTTSTTFYIDFVFGPDFAALTPDPAVLVYPADNGWAFVNGTLSWSAAPTGGIPSGYDVYFDTVNPPVALVSQGQTGTTYTPTLAADTRYYWQVVPTNSSGSATNCPVWSFKTPTATQLAESFEVVTPFLPVGWANPGTWSGTTTSPYHGARVAYKSASTTPALLSTPILEITATSTLDFYYRTASTTGYGLMNIKYSTDRVTWEQIGTTIAMPTTTTWNFASVDLSTIAGNNYFLAFEVLTSTSTSSIYIDHVFGPEYAAIAPGPVTLSAPVDAAVNIGRFPSFTWTAPTTGGVATGYRVYCDTTADPTTLLADVAGLAYTATLPLAYNTMYYWKVVAYNTSGSSEGNTIRSFTTMADPTIYTLPWLEDFGTTGTTFPPTNWTHYSGLLAAEPVTLTPVATGGLLWAQEDWRNETTDPINFSGSINIYSTTRYHWLMTPPIQIPGAGYQLEFDIALTAYANFAPPSDPAGLSGIDDKFVILISDGTSWSTANIVRQYDNAGSPHVYNNVPYTGEHVILPLDSYTGIKYIAFYGESTVSNADNDFFVDNVMVRMTPAGVPDHVILTSPANNATGLDPENVVLQWTDATTGGIPDYYEVFVGSSPIDPSIDYYGEFYYETTANSLVLSDQVDIVLGYSQTLYWAVLPYNTGGAPDPLDPEFMIWRFTTAPDPTITTLPHAEYFDSVTVPNLPWGWTGYVNATSSTAYVRTITTYPVSTPNSVYLTNSTDAAADLRLITPPFSMLLNTVKIKFFARSNTAGYPLLVGTVDTTDGTGTFTQIQSIALTATQTEYTISLADYVGTDTYICFKHGLGGTYRSLYIDNVQFIELLDNDLAATTLTGDNYGLVGSPLNFTIGVFNEGLLGQSLYDVKLMNAVGHTELASITVTDALAPGTAVQHNLQWTPAVSGIYQVYGKVVLTGDQNSANDNTAEKTVYLAPADVEILGIGNPETTTTANTLPTNVYYKNGVTETLYYADEMHLTSGTITALVYKNNFTQQLNGMQFKIYMAHTTATDLTGGWLADTYTLVYDGTLDLPIGINEVIIPLQVPFNYTGGNLAVRFNRVMDTVYYLSTNVWYYTDTTSSTPSRSRYLQSDTVTYDPLAPSAAGTLLSRVPNTWLVVDNAVLAPAAEMNGYVYEAGTAPPVPIAGATVTLTDERYSTTTNAEGYYEFRFWEAHTVSVNVSKFGYYNQSDSGIVLALGQTVQRNFDMVPKPRVTVSGIVTANDAPAGLEGALVKLLGVENQQMVTGPGGAFSFADVMGHDDTGENYTLTVSKENYNSYSAPVAVWDVAVNVGTININEIAWPAYDLVAAFQGNNVQLTWDPAGPPPFYFNDFETDNGGWVPSSNWSNPLGDWEWANDYNVANFTYSYTGSNVVAPPTAFSGAGMWGTKMLTNHTNANGFSYLTQTLDFTGFTNTQMRFRSWENLFGNFDYAQVRVNGTLVWGPSWDYSGTQWQERIINLSAYDGLANVTIVFEMYSTSSVNYAGWYFDDLYIGPAARMDAPTQLASASRDRVLLNYDVYRLLAADEGTPANWTLVAESIIGNSYLDIGLEDEGTYKWAVIANYTADLQSEAVLSNALTYVASMDTPVNVAIARSGADLNLSWDAITGATTYKIYASDDPYAGWIYLGSSATPSYVVTAPAAAYQFYYVTATNE